MSGKTHKHVYVRSAKVSKILKLMMTLSITALSVGIGLFSMRDRAYLYKLFGVVLLFTSSALFMVASFVNLHDREKHAGAYDRSPEKLKKEAKENKEDEPIAVEKGNEILAAEK